MARVVMQATVALLSVLIICIRHIHAHILRLPCLMYGNFSITKNEYRLTSNILEKFSDLSVDECENKCTKHRLCKSINTKNSTGVNCELNNKSTEDVFDGAVLVPSSGWTYKTTDFKARNIGPYCEKHNPCPPYYVISCMDICSCPGYQCQNTTTTAFKHCQEAYTQGSRFTGVYPLHVDRTMFFDAPCDMRTDGGGWIVFQRRVDASVDFYRKWEEYKSGFGDLNGNFWLGLEKIHKLAESGKGAILRVEVKHISNATQLAYAEYSTFEISNEGSEYKLTVGGYSGNAGDSLKYHNGMRFSTIDKDHDAHSSKHCAKAIRAGWWYKRCYESNLNGYFPVTSSSTGEEYMSWLHLHNRPRYSQDNCLHRHLYAVEKKKSHLGAESRIRNFYRPTCSSRN